MAKDLITGKDVMQASMEAVQTMAKKIGLELTEEDIMRNVKPGDLATIAHLTVQAVEKAASKDIRITDIDD